MKMLLFQSIVLCISMHFTLARYGENCETPLGEQGSCVPIRSCKGAFELEVHILKNGIEKSKDEIEFLQNSVCDMSGEKPLICCPKANVQINPVIYNHLSNVNCGSSGSTRVSKGDAAGLKDFRWMALLKYEGREPFACGGTLIDDRHVLTAAHCLHNFENLPIAVRLGEYDINNETDCLPHGKRMKCLDPIEDIGIEKYIIHEDYIYKGIYDDLAILRLERPVNFTKSIKPICLPISKELQYDFPKEFFTAGWGETEYGNRSNVLLWTSLPYRRREFCENSLGVLLMEEHICAGGSRFRDTCKGDSGGPLFYPKIYVDGVARAVQYGVVSFGARNCGEMNLPAVYMNVPYYMQWITDHLVIEYPDSQETSHHHIHHDHHHGNHVVHQDEDNSIFNYSTHHDIESSTQTTTTPRTSTTTTTTITRSSYQNLAFSIKANSFVLAISIFSIFAYSSRLH